MQARSIIPPNSAFSSSPDFAFHSAVKGGGLRTNIVKVILQGGDFEIVATVHGK
jgi:hypothetical protein